MFVIALIFVIFVWGAEWSFLDELQGQFEVVIEDRDVELDDTVTSRGAMNISLSITSTSRLVGILVTEASDFEEEEKEYKITTEDFGDHVTGIFGFSPRGSLEDDMEFEDDFDDEESVGESYEIPLKFETAHLGFHVSHSIYQFGGEDSGMATFTIISTNAFMITMAEGNKVKTISAKRVNIPQGSFLLRFGPMLIMLAVLIVPRLFQSSIQKRLMPSQVPPVQDKGGEESKEKKEN